MFREEIDKPLERVREGILSEKLQIRYRSIRLGYRDAENLILVSNANFENLIEPRFTEWHHYTTREVTRDEILLLLSISMFRFNLIFCEHSGRSALTPTWNRQVLFQF